MKFIAEFVRCVNTQNISQVAKGKTESKKWLLWHSVTHSQHTAFSNDVIVPAPLLKSSCNKSEMPALKI